MLTARRLPNGNLLIPKRAESDDGMIGDGMIEIDPSHPDFEMWLAESFRWDNGDEGMLSLADLDD